MYLGSGGGSGTSLSDRSRESYVDPGLPGYIIIMFLIHALYQFFSPWGNVLNRGNWTTAGGAESIHTGNARIS